MADPETVAAAGSRTWPGAMLASGKRPKQWFRAWFNMGLANKVRGGRRPLPCEAGSDLFFLDPAGNVLPCNGSGEPWIMGNLHDQDFETIWNSEQAREVRRKVGGCERQCWMIGSAAPAMRKRKRIPAAWVLRNKSKARRNAPLEPVTGD